MRDPKKVLVAANLSPAGRAALEYASLLLEHLESELVVVCAVPPGDCPDAHLVEALREPLHDDRDQAEVRVVPGEPEEVILQAAQSGFDYLVIGAGPLARVIERGAPCCVVQVPAPEAEDSGIRR